MYLPPKTMQIQFPAALWTQLKARPFLATKVPSATNFRFFEVLPALMAGVAAGHLSKNPAHHEP